MVACAAAGTSVAAAASATASAAMATASAATSAVASHTAIAAASTIGGTSVIQAVSIATIATLIATGSIATAVIVPGTLNKQDNQNTTAQTNSPPNQLPSQPQFPVCGPVPPTTETGYVDIVFAGIPRTLFPAEAQTLEGIFVSAYNSMSDGCDELFERFLVSTSLVKQEIFIGEDDAGIPNLSTSFEATVRCNGCPSDQPPFGNGTAPIVRDRHLQAGGPVGSGIRTVINIIPSRNGGNSLMLITVRMPDPTGPPACR